MRKIVLVLLLLGFSLLIPENRLWALDLAPVSPNKAILQTQGGILQVEEEVAIQEVDGQSTCSFVLPLGAKNIRVVVQDYTIVNWAQKPSSFKRKDTKERVKLEKRLAEIEIRKKVLNEQHALFDVRNLGNWDFTYRDMEALEKKQLEILPGIFKELAELEQEQAKIQEELNKLPALESGGILVTVTLAQKVTASKVKVKYSYFLSNCGWKPHYTFAIDPDKEKNEVNVRFLADLWQKSGIDWLDTEIILVTGSSTKREPPSLPNWLISAHEDTLRKKQVNAYAMEEAAEFRADRVMAAKAPRNAHVEVDNSGIYSRWSLTSRILKEGRSEMLIEERVLQAPLTWIARPNRNEGQVFLMAKMPIPTGQVWPEGHAVYMVQGQETGQGNFKATSGEVVLYFGSDPRVVFSVYNDKTKRGEEGFFGREKSWSWAWDYTIKNNHLRPIHIRVERPEPRAVNDEIKITFADRPKASIDSKKHIIYWELNLDGGQEITIHHDLTIKAPEKMPVYPMVP